MFANGFPKSTLLHLETKLDQSRKNQTGGWGHNFGKKSLELFLDLPLYPWKFFTLGNFGENKASSLKILRKIVRHPFKDQKSKPMKISHDFILITSWKFHFFFYWPLKFLHALSSIPTPSLEIPRHVLNPCLDPPLIFTGIITHTPSNHNTWNSTTK